MVFFDFSLLVQQLFYVSIQTRGRFGFSFIQFSKNINGRVKNFNMVGFLSNIYSPSGYQAGRVTSLTNPEIDPNTDNLVSFDPNLRRDMNIYPIGFYANDFRMVFFINRTNFITNFLENTVDWNITIGFSYSSKPTSLTTFDISRVSENQTFYWNYTYQTNRAFINRLQPQIFRMEGFHISGYLIMLFFYFFILLILFLFCRKQPLYSRGIYPYFTMIFQLLALLPVTGQFLFTFDQFDLLCIFEKTFQFPMVLCSLALPLFGYFRYVLMLNLNFKKSRYVLSKSDFLKRHKLKSSSRSVCCLKVLGHWLFHLFLLLTTLTIFFSIFLVIFIDSFLTKGEAITCSIISLYQGAGTVYGVFFCLIYLLFFSVFIYELIIQIYMMIKFKKSFWQVLKEDIYLFRVEILVIGGFIVLPYMFIVFILERSYFNRTNLTLGPNYFTYSILISFQYFLLFFMNCGFVLIVTIIKTLVDLTRPNVQGNEEIYLKQLDDEQLQKLFREYLESEFSIENLICFNDIQKYKKETILVNKIRMADEIYLNYFNGTNSTLEVNVDQKSCEMVKFKIDENQFDNLLFEQCEKTIKTNLYDSFSRFASTNAYALWRNRQKELKELE